MAVTTDGSASVDTSPSASRAAPRRLFLNRLMTFPDRVLVILVHTGTSRLGRVRR